MSISATEYLLSKAPIAVNGVLVMYRPERYFRSEILHGLPGTGGDEGELSLTRVNGGDAELRSVMTELRTVSMFGDQRIVLIEDADDFVSANRPMLEKKGVTRPATVPTRSDSIIAMSTQYYDAGDRTSVFDPNNRETRFEFDAAARTTKLIENYQASGPVQPNVNRTTQSSYNADGNVATLTEWNSQTGNQTTSYTYRTTLSDSDLATSTLLQLVAQPDSIGGSDVVLLSYNQLGQRKRFTDQRGCAHSYVFDGLGRQIHDCVTTLGAGVDSAVRRLSARYDVRGLITTMSSRDNATVGSGRVVNQVQNAYNDFAQLTHSRQTDGGAASTGSTPQFQYSYASGSANTIRIIGMTYPNGRKVVDDYETAGSMVDASSNKPFHKCCVSLQVRALRKQRRSGCRS